LTVRNKRIWIWIWIFAFIRRCIRTGFCSPDLADFHDLYISSDQKLFNKILTCPNHILQTLLPPHTAQNYSLRNRPHNRQLPDRISRITDCNFTVRMLYRNMYWLLYILDMRFVLFLCTTAAWQFAINEYVVLRYVTPTYDNAKVTVDLRFTKHSTKDVGLFLGPIYLHNHQILRDSVRTLAYYILNRNVIMFWVTIVHVNISYDKLNTLFWYTVSYFVSQAHRHRIDKYLDPFLPTKHLARWSHRSLPKG